jgi:flagellar hook-basal body complex protein FliE
LTGKDERMKIGQALNLFPNGGLDEKKHIDRTLRETQASFGDTLRRAIDDVNSLQQEAGRAVDRMTGGENIDIHEVMIAVEKAKTSFDLLMEIRNKTLEAYRELMRMQV